MSGTLVSIGSDLGHESLSNMQKVCAGDVGGERSPAYIRGLCQELITSATTLGAFLGGLAAGMLSDTVGRRPVLGIADILFIAGAVGQAICHTVWAMVCSISLRLWAV